MKSDIHLNESLVMHINEQSSLQDHSAELTVDQAYLLLQKFINDIPKTEGYEHEMLLDWDKFMAKPYQPPGKRHFTLLDSMVFRNGRLTFFENTS